MQRTISVTSEELYERLWTTDRFTSLPVGRFGEPGEMAHVATTFLDGKNMYATGQNLMFAGGYNSRMDDLKFTRW